MTATSSVSSSRAHATAATKVITGIDHVVIAVRDLDAATRTYETLLSRGVSTREEGDGVARTVIATDNVAVELMAPAGEGEGAARLRAALESGEGLKSIVFAVADLGRMHRRAERVGLAPEPISEPGHILWRSFRASSARTHGVRMFFIERAAPLTPSPRDAAGAMGLDHVVIRSAEIERAAALYGARLGLDMRLDREVSGRRLMFFRCGDAVVELAEDSKASTDYLWGLSWRVEDADAARARLAALEWPVSDVRAGMKPGSRVFTVRDRTCGVPTLMIEQGRPD